MAEISETKTIDIDVLCFEGDAAPIGLAATAISSSEIDVSWIAVEGVESYELQRSLDGIIFATIVSTEEVTFSDTALDNGTKYFYRVKAQGGIEFSNIDSAVTFYDFLNAIDNDGVNDFMTIVPLDGDVFPQYFFISMWIKINNWPLVGFEGIFTCSDDTLGAIVYDFQINGADLELLTLANNDAGVNQITGTTVLGTIASFSDGDEIHLVMGMDFDNPAAPLGAAPVWLNGVKIDTPSGGAALTTPTTFTISRLFRDQNQARYFRSIVGDMVLCSARLDDFVTDLYNNGDGANPEAIIPIGDIIAHYKFDESGSDAIAVDSVNGENAALQNYALPGAWVVW